jgi:hypothetical protein
VPLVPNIDGCSRREFKQALIDAREPKVGFDTKALYRVGKDAASLTRLGVRVALLARDDMLDRSLGDVIHNRGANIGVFTELAAARDWPGV